MERASAATLLVHVPALQPPAATQMPLVIQGGATSTGENTTHPFLLTWLMRQKGCGSTTRHDNKPSIAPITTALYDPLASTVDFDSSQSPSQQNLR